MRMSTSGQSRPVRASNGSVHARYALKADLEPTDLCRLMVPRCTLYKLPKGASYGCNRTEPICFSPHLYRARNLVERFFNKIKQCRRVATRYDKLAANYLAFIQLASIRLWLRVYEFTALV